jgi:hypothetical protein
MQRDRFSPPELAQGLSGSPTTVLLILTMNFQQLQIPRPPHPCQNPMVHKEPVASHALILKVREFALAPSQLIVSDIHSLKKNGQNIDSDHPLKMPVSLLLHPPLSHGFVWS